MTTSVGGSMILGSPFSPTETAARHPRGQVSFAQAGNFPRLSGVVTKFSDQYDDNNRGTPLYGTTFGSLQQRTYGGKTTMPESQFRMMPTLLRNTTASAPITGPAVTTRAYTRQQPATHSQKKTNPSVRLIPTGRSEDKTEYFDDDNINIINGGGNATSSLNTISSSMFTSNVMRDGIDNNNNNNNYDDVKSGFVTIHNKPSFMKMPLHAASPPLQYTVPPGGANHINSTHITPPQSFPTLTPQIYPTPICHHPPYPGGGFMPQQYQYPSLPPPFMIPQPSICPYYGPVTTRRATRGPSKSPPWKKLLCVEEMKNLGRRGQMWFDNLPSRSEKSARNEYEFRDGKRLVSVDSTEDYWELPTDYPDKLLPARDGPVHQHADDFDLTARDILPWLASLLDNCCCGDKRRPRTLVRPRGVPNRSNGLQLETVCLDCGHVLQQNPLVNNGCRNTFSPNRYNIAGLLPPEENNTSPNPSRVTFDGYDHWDVTATSRVGNRKHLVPLPTFPADGYRVFRNAPQKTGKIRTNRNNDYFTIDTTGRVMLPQFPEEPTR